MTIIKFPKSKNYLHLQEVEQQLLQVNVVSRNLKICLICLVGFLLVILIMFGYIVILSHSDSAIDSALLRKAHARLEFFSWLREEDQDLSTPTSQFNQDKVVSCYYNTPTPINTTQLLPFDINPHLCTHINVAFAQVVDKKISMADFQYESLQRVVKLKHDNPTLKVLLSVGGAGDDNGFSDMVVNHASRKIFIRSIKDILRKYALDGIDLDWEFPAIHDRNDGLAGRERQHFSQLLREIRMEFIREKRDYLLTVAVAAPETIVSVCYDVDQLNTYVDFANVMTYDFHYYTKFTPFTGLNSPLYARSSEDLYPATLNMNYTIQMYLSKGLDRNKIVAGIPTYGHTFKLVNANNPNVGSPASGYGSLGSLGFINYPDVCTLLTSDKNDITVKYDDAARVPYLYKDREWLSYDTPESVTEKAHFIKENNLRGAMIYSLNADDYAGICGSALSEGAKFSLTRSVRRTLLDDDGGTATTDAKEQTG